MVSSYLYLTLSLLWCNPAELMAEPQDLRVRMDPSEFKRMTTRESTTELFALSASERRSIWRNKSRRYFNVGGCHDRPNCMLPYIFCESTPQLTSYARRVQLNDALIDRTPLTKRTLVKIDDLPFFSDTEKTCFTVSMPPKIARSIATEDCESEEKNCLIHPLLPMMKLSNGIVDRVTENTQDEESYMSVMAELSPYHKQKRDDISLEKLVEGVIESGLIQQNCNLQLEDTLPNTGSSLSCEQSLDASQIETEWMSGSVAVFYIRHAIGESPTILREKVLRFVSGLAVRPELSTIEDATDAYYFY
jgi:hypothetical protein